MSSDSRKMEFMVARYASNFGRINVGIVLFERTSDGFSFAKARFTRNMQRILGLDESADIELLRDAFEEIERNVNTDPRRVAALVQIQDILSNAVQFSDSKGIIVFGDPLSEFDKLVSLYLPPETAEI